MPEVLGQPAPGRQQTPKEHASGDDCAAALRICEAANRNAKERVEDREAEAHQQTHLRVTDAEIPSDWSHQQVQNLSIDKGKYIGDSEHPHRVPSIGTRRIRLFLDGGCTRQNRTLVCGQSVLLILRSDKGTWCPAFQRYRGPKTEMCGRANQPAECLRFLRWLDPKSARWCADSQVGCSQSRLPAARSMRSNVHLQILPA